VGTASYPMTAQVWIDFNDNGVFERSETVGGNFTFYASTTLSLSLPSNAALGRHRMRLFVTVADTSGAYYPNMDPCGGYNYGEARDYTVLVTAMPTACTGAPAGGVAQSTKITACATDSFTLSLTGDTRASGLSYQWQSSSDSSTWSNISGATYTPYTTGQTRANYYRCVITCSGGRSGNSAGVYVGYTSYCYCTPVFSYGALGCTYDMYIKRFKLNGVSGTAINDSAACSGGYLDQTRMSASLYAGTTYTGSLTTSSTYTMYMQTWIDFNSNGTFESSETVGYSNAFTGSITYTIGIPAGTATGTYRMRVLLNNSSSTLAPSINPCAGTTLYYYGEARDYTINVVTPSCTGTPTAGTISTPDTFYCGAFVSTIILRGATSGTGISYQWQSSSDGSTFSNISGATNTVYAQSVISSVYIRVMVTCTGGSSGATSAYSNVLLLRYGTAPVIAPITGPSSVCIGAGAAVMADSTPGGTWSSAHPSIATVLGPNVYGLSPGLDTIIYSVTNVCGTNIATKPITVLAAPAAGTISGRSTLCLGDTTTLTPTVSGGTWSVTGTAVTLAGTLATARATGTATVSYAVTNSCGTAYATHDITVITTPAAGTLSGPDSVCQGNVINLIPSVSGGSWSTSSVAIATVTTAGNVIGISGGTVNITYTVSNTCGSNYVIKAVRVNTASGAGIISGPASVCVGRTINLSTTGTGGVWSSDDTSIATVNASGRVTGRVAGTTTISYEVTSTCGYTYAVQNITVQPLAAAGVISGPASFCTGNTNTYTTSGSGGTWSAANPAIATVNPTTGAVYGASAGTTILTYTAISSCDTAFDTITITILPLPTVAPITGSTTVCTGSSITLSDTTTGGTWSSASPTVATISATGVVTALSVGTAVVSYTVTNSCGTAFDTAIVHVLNSSLATAGTITGTMLACPGGTSALADTVTGGSWSSSNTTVATISAAGVVTALSTGTTVISYSVNTICGILVATRTFAVNPLPNAGTISGATLLCPGTTTTLTNSVSGGFWSISNPVVATINNTTGAVQGLTAGTATVTYSNGACAAYRTLTVVAQPGAITGTSAMCIGGSVTLSNEVPGGVWSRTNGTGAISITSGGVVTATRAGTATISYTVGSLCRATAPFNVNTTPGAIGGATSVCSNVTATVTNTVAGGTWTTANATIASIHPTTGVLYGVAAGTVNISYTVGTCAVSRAITVLAAPASISGASTVCNGASITLNDATSGGTWSRTNGTGTGSIVSTTGVFRGLTAGLVTVSYTAGGCRVTTTIDVLANPSAITGVTPVCEGNTITLANAAHAGTWSVASAAIATIGAATGLLEGVAAGTTTVTYSNGCGTAATASVTVNTTPDAIAAPASLCLGASDSLSTSVTGGTWSISDATIASVTAAGILTGLHTGAATITYTLGRCFTTTPVSIITVPDAGTISGADSVCAGASVAFTPSVVGGSWSVSDAAIATVNAAGVLTGLTTGSVVISYAVTNSCGTTYAMATTNVHAAPATSGTITGLSAACAGSPVNFTASLPGGVWSVADAAIASVSVTGTVSGVAFGTTTISYTFSNTCGSIAVTAPFTTQLTPAPLTGSPNVCMGYNDTLIESVPGGRWSTALGTGRVGVDTNGVVLGMAVGTATVSYAIGSCAVTMAMTVGAVPAVITGTNQLCTGTAVNYTNSTARGVWSTSNEAIASISATGRVTAVSAGLANITYTTGFCYVLRPVTVYPVLGPITGNTTICRGGTSTLSDSVAGGRWTRTNLSGAISISAAGVATGTSVGTAVVTYTLANCSVSTPVNVVNSPAAIAGSTNICSGTSTVYSNTVPGGTWASSNATIASVSVSGNVYGVSAGVATITYSLGTCYAVKNITITAMPAPISGGSAICTGGTTTLTNAVAGGTWARTNGTGSVNITSAGVVTGLTTGGATVSYSIGSCRVTYPVTVLGSPAAIAGASSVCERTTISLTNSVAGGRWSTADATVATVNATGTVTGVAAGTTAISYILGSCYVIKNISVNASPAPIAGATSVCTGAA
ncbi:MAG: hypothetical protein EBZ77_02250, partial [Chitinophagia bacterium]|nr:hypothetical protein [Chitinophagia bacterium]